MFVVLELGFSSFFGQQTAKDGMREVPLLLLAKVAVSGFVQSGRNVEEPQTRCATRPEQWF